MSKRYYKLENTSTGKVLASYARPQPNIEGLLYLDEPEIDFPQWNGSAWVEDPDLVSQDYERQVAETDADFVRVLDDLITVLTSTGVIVLDDLPIEAKNKYNNRKSLRENI